MDKKSFRPPFISTLFFMGLCFLFVAPICAQDIDDDERGSFLFGKLKDSSRKAGCGERDEAINTGKEIIEIYGKDDLNKDVVAYAKKKLAQLVEDERTCARNNTYNKLYKDKYWQPFFAVSRQIIDEEGDSPLAMDVILTLVSVGYDRASAAQEDTYNDDTLRYAKLAIERIEAGQESKRGNWGVFDEFNSKENAQSWMNYVVGWLYYYKLNRKKESPAYFDKAMQYAYTPTKYSDNSGTYLSTYYLLGEIYFNELYKSAGELMETNKQSGKLSAAEKAYADRALIAYAKAFQMEMWVRRKELIYKKMENVYRLRFNLPADEQPAGLKELIRELIKQTLPAATEAPKP
ncbi:MAG TPA: hypothetical protein VGC97_00820 [Pyrinomonadaceae bacterium]|jgi:hypothetical protein